MSSTFTVDESQKLAMLIKNTPCLFLQSLSSSRHQNDRKTAWEIISNDMNVNVQTCKKQWKNMRDIYIRVRRLQKTKSNKDTSRVSKASLAYFSEVLENALSFLDDNETSHDQSTDECNKTERGDCNKGIKNNYVQNDLSSTSTSSPQQILKHNKRKLTTKKLPTEKSPTKKQKLCKDLEILFNKLDRDEKENSFNVTTTNEEKLNNVFRPTNLFTTSPSTSQKVQQTEVFEARINKICSNKSPIKKKLNEDMLSNNEETDETINECNISQEDFDISDSNNEDVLSNLSSLQSSSINSSKKKKKRKKITDTNSKLNKDLSKLLNKLDKNMEEKNYIRDSIIDEENSNMLKLTGLYTSSSVTSQQVQQSCISKVGENEMCTKQSLTENINSNDDLLPNNGDKGEHILSVPDEEEPVDVFFKSMALTVKGFSFDIKMRAKKEVFNIISELEIINHNNN